MRLGVLDVGSNTVHLLVVEAHRGAHPWPIQSHKWRLRLAEQLGACGELTEQGVAALVHACSQAAHAAREHDVHELLAFATSAVRDAGNSVEVLRRVHDQTGVQLRVLSGPDEARRTFLAARRWFGWSAGRMLLLDIGGGSLEIAAGDDEDPESALSLPLGAGRLTRQWLHTDPPTSDEVAALESEVVKQLGDAKLDAATQFSRAVGTSNTFRTLARLSGAAANGHGLWTPRELTRAGLRQVRSFIQRIPSERLRELDGVGRSRAHQLLAGAIVAQAVMRRLEVDRLHICPWALREGIIFDRMDHLDD